MQKTAYKLFLTHATKLNNKDIHLVLFALLARLPFLIIGWFHAVRCIFTPLGRVLLLQITNIRLDILCEFSDNFSINQGIHIITQH